MQSQTEMATAKEPQEDTRRDPDETCAGTKGPCSANRCASELLNADG